MNCHPPSAPHLPLYLVHRPHDPPPHDPPPHCKSCWRAATSGWSDNANFLST